MINAGILDKDVVIVQRTPTAQNGEIVVALIGDEATVKRFYKENGHFRLQPENDEFEPIIVDECAVLGQGDLAGALFRLIAAVYTKRPAHGYHGIRGRVLLYSLIPAGARRVLPPSRLQSSP